MKEKFELILAHLLKIHILEAVKTGSKNISRKVKSTLRLKSKQGLPIGTSAPYGYKLNKDTKTWELDPEAGLSVFKSLKETKL